MNKSRAKKLAKQAKRRKRKQEGTWVTKEQELKQLFLKYRNKDLAKLKRRYNVNEYSGTRLANLFEFQRTIIGYTTIPEPRHTSMKIQVEIIDDG